MAPSEFDPERFSRWLSYVLRHNPGRYDLEPDRHGFVALDALLGIAARRYLGVTPERLREHIETEGADRFEVDGGRIRARYGHSIAVEPASDPVAPPERLYHGTEPERAEGILREGLKPMDRRMVHLSQTVEDAVAVGRRRIEQPTVLRIDARSAHEAGTVFYHEGRVYLAPEVPAQFLSVEPLEAEP